MLRMRAPQKARGTADQLKHAIRSHVAGETARAEEAYRALLDEQPDNAVALNNLATIVAGRREFDGALTLLQRAVNSDDMYAEALNNLGLVYNELGTPDKAHQYFARATALNPGNADWLNNYGNACVELREFEDALDAYDRAIALRASEPKYWSNRGIALRGLRRTAESVESFNRALEIDPRHVNALSNVGLLFREEKQFDQALSALERAIALDPRSAPLMANLASVFESMGDFERMREQAERAVAFDPAYAESYTLLANYELEAGRYAEAEALYGRAVSLDPGNRNGNWNLAILWLMHGDFVRGWKQFEWRKQLQSVLVDAPTSSTPEWDGSPLDGRTILVCAEQGMGDTIQFIRYAGMLKSFGAGRVIVDCPQPLVSLVASVPGVDQVLPRGFGIPQHDVHVSLMSLPHLLGTELETIPDAVPYIRSESRPAADLVTAAEGATKIGIVWAGNPLHKRDVLRSVDLAQVAKLLDIPSTKFFSLQTGDAPERQLRELGDSRIVDLSPSLGDFQDTAAVIERLDLVISVDTSVAHLAAAMGKPTWILLPHVADYRWLLDREDSPWYPTARLFRQPAAGQWARVIEAVAAELRSIAVPPIAESLGGAPMTSVTSATRTANGSPRFELQIPIAALATPENFAAYEAELVGEGHRRAIREFWDRAARMVDVFIDLDPALGLTAMSVATAPNASPAVIVLAPNRMLLDAPSNVRVAPDVPAAIAAIRASGATRIGVHAASPSTLDGFAQCLRYAGCNASIEIMSCDEAQGSSLSTLLCAFRPEWLRNELVLRPADQSPGDTVWLPRQACDGISSSATRRVTPVPGSAANVRVGIDWELRSDTGWGIYGSNLALELVRRDDFSPVILAAAERSLTADTLRPLARALRDSACTRAAWTGTGNAIVGFDGIMLRALGNNFGGAPSWNHIHARRNVGVIFFEDTAFDRAALDRARSFDLIVAGCTWNADILRARGLDNVAVAFQGIDPKVFHPAPSTRKYGDRFVIFSGGKLEYRKGQDIVVAAFRKFRERHPEALLLTAWHNPWPHLITDLDLAGHVRGVPAVANHSLRVADWLAENGIPRDAVVDIGCQPNAVMGAIVREADVALFPNRCEGGTNLVAMECMAAGVPTIVSDNTGHRDLVATGGCLAVRAQGTVPTPSKFFRATEGWGETSVDEAVEALELIWRDRQAAESLSIAGAEAMKDWSWSNQIDRLLKIIHTI